MKKFVYSGIAALVVCLCACQKEYNPFEEENNLVGDFRAKINGVQWNANVGGAQREDGDIIITGISADKKVLFMRMKDSGVHNYSFYSVTSMTNTNAAGVVDSTLANVASFATNQFDTAAIYGNVNITSIDTVNKKMSGTFSYKAYRMLDSTMKTVTEGVFTNLSYTTEPPPPSGTDSFRVKIDGNPFSYNLLIGYKGFGMINIAASTGAAPSVGITVPDTVRVGTYPLGDFDYVGLYNRTDTTHLSADTGSVTILEHNITTKRIRGNFHFLANKAFTHQPPNYQLTEGYFSVKYN